MVLGSATTELHMRVSRLPGAGMSVPGEDYEYIPGGYGAIASITLARLGCDVVFCSKIGADLTGQRIHRILDNFGIDRRFVSIDKEARTGLYVVAVEDGGVRRCVSYVGANAKLGAKDLEAAFTSYPDALLITLDIPYQTAIDAAGIAAGHNIPVFIDAAGVKRDFPFNQLGSVEVFAANEHETQNYSGIMPGTVDSCLKASIAMRDIVTSKYYVIKRGDLGSFYYDGIYHNTCAAYDIPVVDRTAAGAAFSAALVLEYMNMRNIENANKFANLIGSLTVSKHGSVTAIPTLEEVRAYVQKNKLTM